MSESAPQGAPGGMPADDGAGAGQRVRVGVGAGAAPGAADGGVGAGAGAPSSDDALLELLAVSAYIRLGLYALVSRHAVGAPDLAHAQRMLVIGTRVGASQQELVRLARARGADPLAMMRPYSGLLSGFEHRTQESLWWEGVLKAVVGHGVAGDLCRLLAHGLPQAEDDVINAALVPADRDQDLRVTQMVAAAATADEKLASRLGLWGRRVVGESLELSKQLLTTRPLLAGLARAAAGAAARGAGTEPPSDVVAWVIGELTAEHARRMDRMGLAA